MIPSPQKTSASPPGLTECINHYPWRQGAGEKDWELSYSGSLRNGIVCPASMPFINFSGPDKWGPAYIVYVHFAPVLALTVLLPPLARWERLFSSFPALPPPPPTQGSVPSYASMETLFIVCLLLWHFIGRITFWKYFSSCNRRASVKAESWPLMGMVLLIFLSIYIFLNCSIARVRCYSTRQA